MTEIQNKATNIEVEIDCKSIIIHWKMWKGKTLSAILFAVHDFPKRIYSNTPIYKDEKIINIPLSLESIQNIRFSYTPGLIIVDEAGLNFNSRKGMTDANGIFSELQFLMRKINCSVIWIAQRFKSIDINARDTTDLIIKMDKIKRYGRPPLFVATREVYFWNEPYNFWTFRIDPLDFFKKKNITYETLTKSKM